MGLLVIDTFLTDTNSFLSLPRLFLPTIQGGKTFFCDKYYLTHSFITIEKGSFLGKSYNVELFSEMQKRKQNFLLNVIFFDMFIHESGGFGFQFKIALACKSKIDTYIQFMQNV